MQRLGECELNFRLVGWSSGAHQVAIGVGCFGKALGTGEGKALRTAQELTAKELRETLRTEADNAASRMIDPFSGRLSSVARDVVNLEIDFAQQQATMWESRKVYSNAIRRWREFAQLANDQGQGWRVAEGLDNIKRLLIADNSLSGDDITGLHSFLTSLHAEYEPLVSKIKSLL